MTHKHYIEHPVTPNKDGYTNEVLCIHDGKMVSHEKYMSMQEAVTRCMELDKDGYSRMTHIINTNSQGGMER